MTAFYVYSNQTTVTDAYTTGNNTLYASGVNATLPENVDTLLPLRQRPDRHWQRSE